MLEVSTDNPPSGVHSTPVTTWTQHGPLLDNELDPCEPPLVELVADALLRLPLDWLPLVVEPDVVLPLEFDVVDVADDVVVPDDVVPDVDVPLAEVPDVEPDDALTDEPPDDVDETDDTALEPTLPELVDVVEELERMPPLPDDVVADETLLDVEGVEDPEETDDSDDADDWLVEDREDELPWLPADTDDPVDELDDGGEPPLLTDEITDEPLEPDEIEDSEDETDELPLLDELEHFVAGARV